MPGHESVTQKLDQPAPVRTRAPVFDSTVWWQISLNVAYVLVAGPRGLGYLLLLTIGLALDLPRLAIYLLLAGSLGLLYSTVRAVLWLLRFGLRFLWTSTIVLLVWAVQTLHWLFISIGSAAVHTLSIMLV